MANRNIAAIDLGASSGRVMLATWEQASHRVTLSEVHRFSNTLVPKDGHDTWDLDALEQEIVTGLNKLDSQGIILDSIGIDTWGVDYVLLDKNGAPVAMPYAYRDHRTDGIMEQVNEELGQAAIYRRTGIQFLPFNTLYQLKAFVEQQPQLVDKVDRLLLIPDYLCYRLTGQMNWEYTNASTTQLLNLQTGDWDQELLDYLGVPRRWFETPTQPGNIIGHWQSQSGQQVPVYAVATHDTASAVIAAPLQGKDAAYLSSGTWSLMGLDSPQAFNDDTALTANITNEGGINGHYRVLKNIMGLWLCQRVRQELNISDLPAFIEKAAGLPPFERLINPNDPRFLNPPSMVEAIRAACAENQQPEPTAPEHFGRCIFDSLALLYGQVATELSELRGRPLKQLHIVGGGSQNGFLNQLCADICQLPVTAGPIEGSALGNVGCQLMALAEIPDVSTFRQVLSDSFPIEHYQPTSITHIDTIWQRFTALAQKQEEISL